MLLSIVRYTPPWVWGLLAALLALGFWQARPRRVARAQILALPLVLLMLGLVAQLANFRAQPLAIVLWAAAVAAAAMAGRRLLRPAGATWQHDTARLHLPGSWIPMLLIVALFLLRYTVAVSQVLHPAWRSAPEVLLPVALLYGTLSGLFFGRALGLLALTRPATIGLHDLQPQR